MSDRRQCIQLSISIFHAVCEASREGEGVKVTREGLRCPRKPEDVYSRCLIGVSVSRFLYQYSMRHVKRKEKELHMDIYL